MNPLTNPFSPGAGNQPPELAGRDELLRKVEVLLARVKAGRSEQSMFMVGLRGVGKTVLLNRVREMAESQGYQALLIEAHESKPLPLLLLPPLRQTLFALDRMQNVSQKVKRGLRVLRSFIGAVKVKVGEAEFGLDIDPETGSADSGDLEADLAELFVAVGEAAADRGTAVAIIVDELQYMTEVEMSALIMAIHKVSQRSLPLVLIGAGLPQLVGLAGKSKSYAERLFTYPEVGALTLQDSSSALQGPVVSQGVTYTPEALAEVFRVTQGYPYFLQEWGYQSWNLARQSPIDLALIQQTTVASTARLDQSFFRVRFDRLTPREKDYLSALAELGTGNQRSGGVAERLGVKVQTIAPLRSSLIKKGMIYSPAHGDTAFTVPLFDQFMLRTMPDGPRKAGS
ncbi:AAA family ATPase [Rhodoferax antarcticus]|uniref:ATPase n=1 Tax=Rhodoferax antarcticus ANT.BR TaxID=1111071 RepID=A0A1Q8YD02_9BURK|nr:ATP-binding protein [Rhodoferax antarcticus]APW45804.1 AAA family ATPase [Rhodoferax antarcticus]OLP05883.1 ATPase [Rhodoferax antarcticus ANT.BR]